VCRLTNICNYTVEVNASSISREVLVQPRKAVQLFDRESEHGVRVPLHVVRRHPIELKLRTLSRRRQDALTRKPRHLLDLIPEELEERIPGCKVLQAARIIDADAQVLDDLLAVH